MNRRTLLKTGAVVAAGTAGVVPPGELSALEVSRLFVPPEEAPHARTLMQWPTSRIVHPNIAFLKILQRTIANIANAIAEFEPVVMLTSERDMLQARRYLSSAIEHWDIPTEDLWCRDSGPLFAKKPDGQLVISHIQFNGWGNKQVHKEDGQIARRVAQHLDLPLLDSGLLGEAGGVEHDGHGRLIAHESSWLNDNRNPGLSRDAIEARLLLTYGADRMIWSPGVWAEDITDYHIDSLARFTGPGRVLINLPDTPEAADPFHQAALKTHDALVAAGLAVDVIDEPQRRRVKSVDFVASYANYYVCNAGVIAAQFGDRQADEAAVETLRRHYPDRSIVTLNVDALGEVGGGIHCATQQMPA